MWRDLFQLYMKYTINRPRDDTRESEPSVRNTFAVSLAVQPERDGPVAGSRSTRATLMSGERVLTTMFFCIFF